MSNPRNIQKKTYRKTVKCRVYICKAVIRKAWGDMRAQTDGDRSRTCKNRRRFCPVLSVFAEYKKAGGNAIPLNKGIDKIALK